MIWMLLLVRVSGTLNTKHCTHLLSSCRASSPPPSQFEHRRWLVRGQSTKRAFGWHSSAATSPSIRPSGTRSTSMSLERTQALRSGSVRRRSGPSSASSTSGQSATRPADMSRASTISPRPSFRSFSAHTLPPMPSSTTWRCYRPLHSRPSRQIHSGVYPSYSMASRTTTSLHSQASSGR